MKNLAEKRDSVYLECLKGKEEDGGGGGGGGMLLCRRVIIIVSSLCIKSGRLHDSFFLFFRIPSVG